MAYAHRIEIHVVNPNAHPKNIKYSLRLRGHSMTTLCEYKYNFLKDKPKSITYFKEIFNTCLSMGIRIRPVDFYETISGTYYTCPVCKNPIDLIKVNGKIMPHYAPMKTCTNCGTILYSFFERKSERDGKD